MPRIYGAHINVTGLSHRYRNGKSNALDSVDLVVVPGEIVALIGRSGCGKSTLLHIIAGLVKPSRGSVHIDGQLVAGPSPQWVMMFQQPSLMPWLNVAQNIALGLVFNNRKAEAKQRVPELLELVQLSDFASRNVQDLSGGQQQRVALARSLALKPQVLLLDEPFSALDAFTRASLQRDVRRIARELGITTVLVTHDVSEAALMADRAVIMTANPGRIRRSVVIDASASDGGEGYQTSRDQLMAIYEEVVGAAAVGHGPGQSTAVAGFVAPAQKTTLVAPDDQRTTGDNGKLMTNDQGLPCGCEADETMNSTNGLTRRHSLDALAAGGLYALFSTLFGGFPSPLAAAEDDIVRIGYLPITDATALLVAHAKGFFKDEGLEAEKPTLMRGWSPLVEGFAAGKFNLVHLLKPIPVWMRYNNKFPVKIMAWAHTNGSGLVVGPHKTAANFADLGGSQIAVPFWYSMHNIVLQMALRNAGLTPVIKAEGQPIGDKEVNLQVLAPPEMPPALAAKKIDAYIVAEPFNALGELKVGARMLRFTGDMWRNHPCCVVCMNEQLTTAKPEWTQKVVNAVVKAAIYASENKAEVAKLLSKDGQGYLPVPAPVVERAMTLYDLATYGKTGAIRHPEWGNGRIDFNPWPYPSATELIVGAMGKTLVGGDTKFLSGLDPKFVAKDLVSYDFVKKALEAHPDWKKDPSVAKGGDPYIREEVIAL